MTRQARHLIRKQFRQNMKDKRFVLVLAVAATICCTGLVMANEASADYELPTWLVMVTAWLWLGLVFFSFTDIINYTRASLRIKRDIRDYVAHAPENAICYNDDMIQYLTGSQAMEVKWKDVSQYFEHDGSLFLTPNKKLLESIYFSRTDIGDEAYEKLRSFIATKVS